MQESTKRFTSRVENYVKYRPHYPPDIIQALTEECGLTPEWVVADIGSGTGISTELFLRNGNRTYGVEPNAAMREAAKGYLQEYPNFISIDGTAEATTLPEASIDLVTVGQAFHWFDIEPTRQEFQRIVKPGGWVALFWNDRRQDGSPFSEAYEQLLHDCAPEYGKVNHRKIDRQVLEQFFAPGGYQEWCFEYLQYFNFESLKGRLLSSSYAPEPGHAAHAPMMERLSQIFAEHQQDGLVTFPYDTHLYYGHLGNTERLSISERMITPSAVPSLRPAELL